jgi:DNA-directed RNA polymerase subunit RPC12/RpoP
MVHEEPPLLEGVVHCPNCNGRVFAITELVMYEQDKQGNFTAFDVVIDEDPQVRCLKCGSLMTDSTHHTILNRTMESVDEIKGQSA